MLALWVTFMHMLTTVAPFAAHRYGPDRKLFLPGGLLDTNDVPAYLDGA